MKPPNTAITAEDIEQCTLVLEALVQDPLRSSCLTQEQRTRLLKAAGLVNKPQIEDVRRLVRARRRARREERQNKDRSLRAATTIRIARERSVFVPPPRHAIAETRVRELLTRPRWCYVCKAEYREVHFFYDALCPACADFNYQKRFQTASLQGKVALITGARLKIGYQAALMMLRAGARVIVTTRFPHDAALRYSREEDVQDWGSRLQIFGLDLRHASSVERFTQHIHQSCDRLDILINNAAQTVRRPPRFYEHLIENERLTPKQLPLLAQSFLTSYAQCLGTFNRTSLEPSEALTRQVANGNTESIGLLAPAELSQLPYRGEGSICDRSLFPDGKLDADLQQIDLRDLNSWRMTLAQVPTAEMIEVHLVNAVAPFILCGKLKPLMLRDYTGEKHIVNVSAMEGQFARNTKTDKHPHTNMAKAALNMMTVTSARDYAQSGIFMNAVDTGWVTDEDPASIVVRKQAEHDFQPPLDIVDGAARVCDPFFSGILSGKHSYGNFLKDYMPTDW